jgi:hypothetical protein
LTNTVERRSRLVSLAYDVLGTIDLPPVDASEGEVLVALASAFHRKALVAVEAELDPLSGFFFGMAQSLTTRPYNELLRDSNQE